jgi:hypothetical protein
LPLAGRTRRKLAEGESSHYSSPHPGHRALLAPPSRTPTCARLRARPHTALATRTRASDAAMPSPKASTPHARWNAPITLLEPARASLRGLPVRRSLLKPGSPNLDARSPLARAAATILLSAGESGVVASRCRPTRATGRAQRNRRARQRGDRSVRRGLPGVRVTRGERASAARPWLTRFPSSRTRASSRSGAGLELPHERSRPGSLPGTSWRSTGPPQLLRKLGPARPMRSPRAV